MRNITKWKEKLVKELNPLLEGDKIKGSRFVDIELSLYLMESLGFVDDPFDCWTLFTGHIFEPPSTPILNFTQRKLIANARFYLQYYKSSFQYKEYLAKYLDCKASLRLYDIDKSSKSLLRLNPSFYSERDGIYHNTLETYPCHRKEELKWAKAGMNYFNLKHMEQINIPKGFLTYDSFDKAMVGIHNKTKRDRIKIDLEELIKTAEYMDSTLGMDRYKKVIEKLSFLNIKDNKVILQEREFFLDGLSHMVGMVGAGKSTLMEVLAVYCSKRSIHITLVLDSISSIFNILSLMQRLDVKAAPFWGISNREEHIKKLINISQPQSLEDIKENQLYKMVSNLCPLDGLRNDLTVNEAFQGGKQPCHRLLLDPEDKTYLTCPYYYSCSYHRSSLALIDADIYLATPASFIHSWIPAPIYPYKMRASEFIYRKSDVVVFDEADRVQINFDSFFTPSEVLIDDTGDSWMNKLGARVSAAFYTSGRKQRNNREANTWYEEYYRLQRILDLIYKHLTNNKNTFGWIKDKYFSANRLIYTLADKDEDYSAVELALEEFRKDPIGKKKETLLSIATSKMVYFDEDEGINNTLGQWLNDFGCLDTEDRIDRIKLILLVSLLERGLRIIIDSWDEASEAFNTNMDNIPFFTNHLKDYSSIIPESPPGNIFGFRYTSNKDNSPSTLYVIRTMGIGRWILTNFSHMLLESEGVYGPHSLLLSGTSWAPGSPSYNIDTPPTSILKGRDEEIKAIEDSLFFVTPAEIEGKLISISGSQGDYRKANLSKLLHYLITPRMKQGTEGKSIIDYELGLLPDNRKRILLLVGSYDETHFVKDYLDNHLTKHNGWDKGHIVKMIRDGIVDDDGEVIQRGIVNTFASMEGKILIAPLLAVERGHNILNEENLSALGSAFFLIRPMPVPNDLKGNIFYINKWAMDRKKDLQWIEDMEGAKKHDKIIRHFRRMARRVFEGQLREREKSTYNTMTDQDSEALCWTQMVVIWQVIGRLVRGGSAARVHFCDAKYAPNSAIGKADSSKSSILAGIRSLLSQYFSEDENSISKVEKEIAKYLYSPLFKALTNIKGVEIDE